MANQPSGPPSPGKEVELGTLDLINAPIEFFKKSIHQFNVFIKDLIEGAGYTTADIEKKFACFVKNPFKFLSCL